MAWSKESRQSRGYGAAWDRVRKVVLKRDFGLCQPCRRRGLVTIAKEVDHIISKARALALRWSQARMDAPGNLQAICKPCHEAKTEEEQGKTKREKSVPGDDGWPVPAPRRGRF
jgi:5-methylcytosine-specific restriction protein A